MPPYSVLENIIQFLDEYLPQWFEKKSNKPLFLFISGPQGSGKTYNSEKVYKCLQEKYKDDKKNIAYVSIDDFYLTHSDQLALENKFPDNPLFKGRGLPGTHDMALLSSCVDTILAQGDGKEVSVKLPQYDKSLFNGEGDRSSKCLEVKLPIDIIIFEGWFVGYEAIIPDIDDESTVIKGDMERINSNLFMYADLLWGNPEINSLGIVFAADDIKKNVYQWRLQQEHQLISNRGTGMTDEQVLFFVDRYYPSYKLYYDSFVHGEQLGSIATLTLAVDLERNVIARKIRCIE